MRVAGAGTVSSRHSRVFRMPFWFIVGMTLLVHYGMGSEEEVAEEAPAEEGPSCDEQMQQHSDRVKQFNDGTFEIPSLPPENGIRYPNGAICFDGGKMSPSKLAETKKANQEWDDYMRETCNVDYIPAFDELKINKVLAERGLGSRCKAGTCYWDTKIRDAVCGSVDPRVRGSGSKFGNPSAAETTPAVSMVLVIYTLLLVELFLM